MFSHPPGPPKRLRSHSAPAPAVGAFWSGEGLQKHQREAQDSFEKNTFFNFEKKSLPNPLFRTLLLTAGVEPEMPSERRA